MNSLPRPGPSLRAETLPSWSSTSFRTIVRPTPRPPSDRASVRSPWANRSKIWGSTSGAMPSAIVGDPEDDPVPVLLGGEPDAAPGRGVPGGVGQEVHQDLLQADRVGRQPEGPGDDRHLEPLAAVVDQVADRLDGPVDDRVRRR